MGHQTFIPRDYDVFAGLDVDKRSISVTFTDHQGLLKSLRIPNNVEHLVNHVRKHFPNQRVAFAYEAGPTGYGLYDGLVAQEFRCLIAIDDSQSARTKSEDQSARQCRTVREFAWGPTQRDPCS